MDALLTMVSYTPYPLRSRSQTVPLIAISLCSLSARAANPLLISLPTSIPCRLSLVFVGWSPGLLLASPPRTPRESGPVGRDRDDGDFFSSSPQDTGRSLLMPDVGQSDLVRGIKSVVRFKWYAFLYFPFSSRRTAKLMLFSPATRSRTMT
ncbi:hypothetical protein DFJ77DRAFT_257616 [Powellomyces hirtus]|nr:hypothetical protein DFJ77DRAFT_257616 [Powellomyces hirtus]